MSPKRADVRLRSWIVVFSALATLGCGDDDGGGVDAGPIDADSLGAAELLPQMTDLDTLAAGRGDYRSLLASSYNRMSTRPGDETWFANGDKGHFQSHITVDGRGEHVLLEVEGAGVLERIWSANPQGTLRIYLDDFETPAIEANMEALLGGDDPRFPEPFAYVAARGFNFYFPIGFSQRIRVTTDEGDVDREGGIDSLYFHVGYRLYPGTPVETWTAAAHEARLSEVRALGAELLAPPAATSLRSALLGPMPTVFEATGGAAIRELRIEAPVDESLLRSAVVSIAFDGRETVRAPLGDFFGSGPELQVFKTYPLEVTADRVMICRFVMPFRDSAAITIESEGDLSFPAEVALGGWTFGPGQYFHAKWRDFGQIDAQPRRDLTLGTLTGNGRLVGLLFEVANPSLAWWGEGDEKIFVDDDMFPSWFGTGTEDYFGYAYTDLELFDRPYHAQTRTGADTQVGHISNLRLHVLDPIPFESRLQFDMELWHWAETELSVQALMYWYGETTDDFEPLEPGSIAIPVEALVGG